MSKFDCEKVKFSNKKYCSEQRQKAVLIFHWDTKFCKK